MRAPGTAVVAVVALFALVAVSCGSSANIDNAGRDPLSGVIVKRGDVGTQRLRVGDCFVDPGGVSAQVVRGVPCVEPHDSQVVALIELPDASSSEWPGDSGLAERTRSLCLQAALSALDGNLSDPTVGLSAFVPNQRSWDSGDRRVLCTLGRFDGSFMTGSLLGRSA